MSAPDTNTEKQKDRHKTALFGGIAFPILWGVILLIGLVIFVVWQGQDPVGADEVIDGRTGEVTAPTLAN